MKFFSPAENGFYDSNIHKKLPEDAIEVSEEKYMELYGGQAHGKTISVSESGEIVLIDIPMATLKNQALKQLERDMHQYIYHDHGYPAPTQTTLQVMYSDPSTTEPARAACLSVFGWITGSVLPYYYSKKDEINGSENPERVTWEFLSCDPSCPSVTLADIIAMNNG